MRHELSPTTDQIKTARKVAELTQEEAADLLYRNSLQRWSEWETGLTSMPPADWELFLIKTGQHPDFRKFP